MFFFSFLLFSTIKFDVQKDHFQAMNDETISLYGYEDLSFIPPTGFTNIILTLCGKQFINPQNPFPDPVKAIANQTNAYLLSLEQRYFANSIFTPNTSTDNLEFLTIDQILQDIVEVISYQQNKCLNNSCNIFLVGSSESADILSWFRMKYPQLSVGLWSSFGMTDTPVFDYDFDPNLIKRLKLQSEDCYITTTQILASLEWSITKGSKESIYKLFDFPLETDERAAMYMFTEMFSLLDDLANDGSDMFSDYCSNVSKTKSYENFATYFKNVLTRSGYTSQQFNPFELQNTSISFEHKDERLWWYMKCTQKGRFHISNGLRAEEIDEKFFRDICIHLFQFDPKIFSFSPINSTRTIFGGKDYRGTNAIFTRSKDDLNYGIMPNEYERNNIKVFELPNAGESFDLRTYITQPKEEKDIKTVIEETAVSWLQDECNSKCEHGNCILQKCVCNDEWSGEFCSKKLVKQNIFNALATVATLIPTIILIVFGSIGWYMFMKQDQKSRIII